MIAIASELADIASFKKTLNDYEGKIASVPRARPISLPDARLRR